MEKNLGHIDRKIRIVLAIVLTFLFFTKIIAGPLAILGLLIAAQFVITGFISFCPVYDLLGINTAKRQTNRPFRNWDQVV